MPVRQKLVYVAPCDQIKLKPKATSSSRGMTDCRRSNERKEREGRGGGFIIIIMARAAADGAAAVAA